MTFISFFCLDVFAQKDKKPGGVAKESTRYIPEDRSGNTGSDLPRVEEVVVKPTNNSSNDGTIKINENSANSENGNFSQGQAKNKSAKPKNGKTPTAKKSVVSVCSGNWKKVVVCTVVQALTTEVVGKLSDWIDDKIQEHFYQGNTTPNIFNGQMTIINSNGQHELITITINHSLASQGTVYSVRIIDSNGEVYTGHTQPMTDTN